VTLHSTSSSIMLAAYGAFTSYVISKTTHFHYCIVPDEMCIMEWESS